MSNITPGADNFGEQASGGIAGVALSVADANARESGLEAMRNTPGYDHRVPPYQESPYAQRAPRGEPSSSYDDPYVRPSARQEHSHSSLTPLGAAAFPPGIATPHSRSTASPSPHSFHNDPYMDNPYNRRSRNLDPLGPGFDPNLIADDGDDGLEYRHQSRSSMLSLGHHSDRGATPGAATAGAGSAAAGGGILGTLGGLVGRNVTGNRTSPQYDPVQNQYGGPNDIDIGHHEKSEWLSKQSNGNKKLRWLVGILLALLIIGGITGGVVGGVLSRKKSSSNSSSSSTQGQSASSDTQDNGDLNADSAEIKKLLNNKNLHKVFPGIDYTPMYTQYPGCLTYPASQNNVTRDLAVLSQLTNTIRLYGTDCNQTELLLHSIDQLNLNGTVKVWLGVWQDNNATTNARQLQQMYDIFDKYGTASFVGAIVGNEVLFRQDMTATELGEVISGVKSNFTAKGINLPVASSDLGDSWSTASEVVSEIDYLMSNIHPFFAGVTAEEAASWTYDFWTQHDTILKTDITKNVISETGWPSQGGMDCGGATTCTNGSIAGIQEMNTFMDGWVCQALANNTNYFWFEAFDEPWKIQFDTTGEDWEDHWGLMDVNRNLKDGVVIPDCGGKTVS
jgi:exo-beta-1,3-glucanase (GH17 family)